jgi:CheY-like chemotaxis protein
MPAVVLLDLKMPRATGFDVLRWIRAHPEAGNIPIIVFSGSELQDDIRQAYAVGADSYLVKPIGFNALVDLVKQIDHGWIAGYDGKAPTLSSPGRGTVWGGHLDWCGDNEARP